MTNNYIQTILEMVLSVPGVILAFTLRGFCQALVADKLGDPTPRNMGRLTMNPMAHMDWFGFIFLLLFHFGWTKPMQVNTRNFQNEKRDNAIFILSGPVGGIVAGFVCSFFYVLFTKLNILLGVNSLLYYLAMIFGYAMQMCIMLAAFYLLPLPGLDGYNLIANFLPYRYYNRLYTIQRYSMFIFMGFILLISVTNLSTIIFWPASMLIEGMNALWTLVLCF